MYRMMRELSKAYISSVAKLNKGNEHHLTIVLPGSLDEKFIKEQQFQDYLKSKGIGEISIKTVGLGPARESITRIGDSPKRLTLITGRIVRKDMLILWKNSEKEVLATGDQSVGEAISADKSMVIEYLTHKADFLVPLGMLYKERIVYTRDDCANYKQMTRYFRENQKNNYLQLTQLNTLVAQVHDCFPKMVSSILETLKRPVEALDFRDEPEKLTAADIPFEKKCIAMNKDVKEKLQMEFYESSSPLPEFADSVFAISEYTRDSVSFLRFPRPAEYTEDY